MIVKLFIVMLLGITTKTWSVEIWLKYLQNTEGPKISTQIFKTF